MVNLIIDVNTGGKKWKIDYHNSRDKNNLTDINNNLIKFDKEEIGYWTFPPTVNQGSLFTTSSSPLSSYPFYNSHSDSIGFDLHFPSD